MRRARDGPDDPATTSLSSGWSTMSPSSVSGGRSTVPPWKAGSGSPLGSRRSPNGDRGGGAAPKGNRLRDRRSSRRPYGSSDEPCRDRRARSTVGVLLWRQIMHPA